MSPPAAGQSLFMRFFGLIENYPLYVMTGYACALAVYTPIRHLMTASDVALDRKGRDYGDDLGENPRTLERAKLYERGILAWLPELKSWPEVIALPKDTPNKEHFTLSRWPRERTFEMPQVPDS